MALAIGGIGQRPTVNEYELDGRIFLSNLTHRGCLQVARSDDDFRAVVDRLFHSGNTVVIRCIGTVGGLIVLVGNFVCFRVRFCPFIGSLVEALVHQLSDICHDSNLILLAAGRQDCQRASDHYETQCEANDSFHGLLLLIFYLGHTHFGTPCTAIDYTISNIFCHQNSKKYSLNSKKYSLILYSFVQYLQNQCRSFSVNAKGRSCESGYRSTCALSPRMTGISGGQNSAST